jgi:hypothetical protein
VTSVTSGHSDTPLPTKPSGDQAESNGPQDDRVERLARQLAALSSPLDAAPLEPVVELDQALALDDPVARAEALYRLVLGRPPEDGSGAAAGLVAGGSTIDLAYDLVASEEAAARSDRRRPALLRELRLRTLRQAWALPVTGPIGPLARDPRTALAMAAVRVSGSAEPAGVQAGVVRIGEGVGREGFLRELWRDPAVRERARDTTRRDLRGVRPLLHRLGSFHVFRSHVLAVEPAAQTVLTILLVHDDAALEEAADRLLARETAARLNEVAAGVRLLLGDRTW